MKSSGAQAASAWACGVSQYWACAYGVSQYWAYGVGQDAVGQDASDRRG